ncbi:GNAT family N-acetyltransferase [Brevibacillus sp. NRS-1366]|uniref:GNAT family N-acetyltransferase n=1 Tax=Brevibacillus sp. NRS-1366 TaxID=3233899 RepID=UPI003D21280B
MIKRENIRYRKLGLDDFAPTLLARFKRYQETTRVWYQEEGHFHVKNDHFIDEWDDGKKLLVIQELRECVASGGAVVGAFVDHELIGFANVQNELFGSSMQYVELPYIHVSSEARKTGIGKKLIELACEEARLLGAEKLYIAAHPSEETQHFYRSVGCTYAEEINQSILEREPLDIQLELTL